MRIFTFLFIFFLAHHSFSKTFFIETPNVVGGDQELKRTMHELISQYIEEKNHEISNSPNQSEILIPSILKIGTKYIIVIKRKSKGKIISKKIKVKSLDNLDTAISRALRALIKKSSIRDSRKVNEITDQEIENRNKKIKATDHVSIGIGPTFSSSLDAKNSFGLLIGKTWELDSYFNLHLRGEISESKGNNQAGMMSATIGGSYIFTDDIHAPYALTELGYGMAENKLGADSTGWAVGVGGGMSFFRASTINFSLETKVQTILEKIGNKTPSQFSLKIIVHL